MKAGGRRATLVGGLGVIAAAVFAVVGARAVTVGLNVNITKSIGYEGEPTIAIQRTNTNNLFAAFNTLGNADYRKSTNGGASWSSVTTPPSPASCCDNQSAADSFGNIFLVDVNSATTDVRLFMSIDGGNTWGLLGVMDAASAVDQPSVAVGAGSVWVVWQDRTGPSSAFVLKARGAPVTGLGMLGAFSAEQPVPGSEDCRPTGLCGSFGDIAVGPSGQVTVTYQSGPGEGPGVVYSNTDLNGLAAGGFGPQVTVAPTNVGQFETIPAQNVRSIDAEAGLAWDRTTSPNGRLYLVYTDETPDESDNTDIYVARSTDSGSTWSAPVKVNDDATTRSQMLPHIAVDQTNASIAVTWYDARNDPANNNVQLWGAFSANGGVSFGTNFQISTGTSNDDYYLPGPHPGGSVDYGDFRWSDYHAGKLYPIWADNSNSTGDNPAGANGHFDMYTAQVSAGTTGVAVRRLDATRTRQGVALRWSTASEAGVGGFNLFRDAQRLNRALIRAQAAGRATGNAYRFVDGRANPGAASSYRLQVVGLDGSRSWQGSASTVAVAPTRLTASIAARPNVSGVFVASLTGRTLTWRLFVHGLGNPLAAEVRATRTGNAVGTLCRSCSRNASGKTILTAATVAALKGGAAYLNVHPTASATPRILARVTLGAPTLEIMSPKDGDTITLPAEIAYKVSSFQVGPAPNGHLQVADAAGGSVLALPVPGQAGTATIPDSKRWLLGGPHDLTFSLVTSDGSRVPNPEASVTIRGIRIIGRR